MFRAAFLATLTALCSATDIDYSYCYDVVESATSCDVCNAVDSALEDDAISLIK